METPSTPAAPPGFEPLGFGNLLDRVFKICWRKFPTFATIVGVLVVPTALLFYATFLTFPWDALPETPRGSDIFAAGMTEFPFDRLIVFGVLFTIGLVISMIGTMAASGASIIVAERAHAGLEVSAKAAMRGGLRRAHSLLWVMILGGLLAMLAFSFVLAPGVVPFFASGFGNGEPAVDVTSVLLFIGMLIVALTVAAWLWLMWILSPVVVVTEDVRGSKALRRSFRLVKGKVFWIGAVVFVAFVAQWTLGSVFTIPAAFLPLDPFAPGFRGLLLAQMVLGILPTFVYVPLQAAVNSLVYVDARVRKEGLTRESFVDELQSSRR